MKRPTAKSVGPMPAWLNPAAVSPAQHRNLALRAILDDLLLRGKPSCHSHLGLTVAYIVEQLEARRVPYTITAYPGVGYMVRRASPLVPNKSEDRT